MTVVAYKSNVTSSKNLHLLIMNIFTMSRRSCLTTTPQEIASWRIIICIVIYCLHECHVNWYHWLIIQTRKSFTCTRRECERVQINSRCYASVSVYICLPSRRWHVIRLRTFRWAEINIFSWIRIKFRSMTDVEAAKYASGHPINCETRYERSWTEAEILSSLLQLLFKCGQYLPMRRVHSHYIQKYT